jgi:hypothetical protein
VTNIDVLREYFNYNRTSEKRILNPAWLNTDESLVSMIWSNFIFLKLLRHDTEHYFDWYSIDDFFDTVLDSIELIVILITIIVSLTWLFWPLIWVNNYSLYLLPAMWWLWLLVYLLNSLHLRWFISRIVCFIIIVWIYLYWLTLLLNTFAL